MSRLKSLVLPDRPVRCTILRGPFRGARVRMNPQNSLRYLFGLYEHELNPWLTGNLPLVNAVFDVGANHGYFALGVFAAWRRLGIVGRGWAFEPQVSEVSRIGEAIPWNPGVEESLRVEQTFVSDREDSESVSLDGYLERNGIDPDSFSALVKIDVEGAEVAVLRGAASLLRGPHRFLVEVHNNALREETLALFADHGHAVRVIEQRPLPLLGREHRDPDNAWVVSV